MSISIGIMTQRSKQEHIQVLFHCLLQQADIQKIDLLIYSEEGFQPSYPSELLDKYGVQYYHYNRPFNIGRVRNAIIKNATTDYVLFLDDDVAIAPNYIEKLFSILSCKQPAILAGLSYHIFKRPSELLKLIENHCWTELIATHGKRDCYTRKIGRYHSEHLSLDNVGEANWLGAIGRNFLINRELALIHRFFEYEKMGFEDVEMAYRLQNLGFEILLQNTPELACLHMFHAYSESKVSNDFETFSTLTKANRLPLASKTIFFPSSTL